MPRAAFQPEELVALRTRAAEAATRLFAERGYAAVTMRALAEELGVSAMTPYRYLPGGKDELIALVRTSAFCAFADALEAGIAKSRDPEDRLRRLKHAYLAFAVEHADAYRIMFELRGAEDTRPWPELDAQATRAFGVLHGAVRLAIDAGVLEGDSLTIAHILWAGAHGLASLHLAGRLSPSRPLARLASIDHELAGFRARRTRRTTR